MKKTSLSFLFIMMFLTISVIAFSCSSDGSGEDDTKTDGDSTDNINQPDGDGTTYPQPDGDGSTTPSDGDSTTIPTDGDDLDQDVAVDGDSIVEKDVPEIEIAEPEMDHSFELKKCDFNSSLTEPRIKASETALEFGSVPTGSSLEKELTLCNESGVDLKIELIQLNPGSSPEFHLDNADLPITLPPGRATIVYALYLPVNQQADKGDIVVISNDPAAPNIKVALSSSAKQEPVLSIEPRVMQFAKAPEGNTIRKDLIIKNVGTANTTIRPFAIGLGDTSPYVVEKVVYIGDTDDSKKIWPLKPGDGIVATVAMTMGATPVNDTLTVIWDIDGDEQRTSVSLEIGESKICAVADAGEDQTASPLTYVMLDGTKSHDDNGVILGYKWKFLAKPEHSDRAVLMVGNEKIQDVYGDYPTPTFFAVAAGTYTVELQVKDSDDGCTGVSSDIVEITVKPDETIHIQLNWSTPNNDHDLHLIKPFGCHTRDCGDAKNDTDCCWQNCATWGKKDTECPPRGCPGPEIAPDWGVTSNREDDPTLDIDDKDGTGPENINLSYPIKGDYLITVENYKGYDTDVVTSVKVYLFGNYIKTYRAGKPYTTSSIPLGYHWNVAWVRVESLDPGGIKLIDIPYKAILSDAKSCD